MPISRTIPPRCDRQRGFTLVELLVVCALLSFLGSVLYATFYQGIGLWRRAQADRGEFRDAFFAEKMISDLRNITPLGDRPVNGSARKFQFYALVPGRELGQQGETGEMRFPCRLRYSFDESGRQVRREIESYSQILTGAQGVLKSSVVFEGVKDLEIQYYGRGTNPGIHWQKSWKKECLPNAVKLSMQYEDQKQIFVRLIPVPGGGCRSAGPKAA